MTISFNAGNRWQSGNRYGKQGNNRSYGGNQWYTIRVSTEKLQNSWKKTIYRFNFVLLQ